MGKDASGTTINTSAYVGRLLESIPASYTVFKIGSDYYAECNGASGTDYSDPDEQTVLQAAVDAISSGGVVFVKGGSYTLDSTFTVKENVQVIGEGIDRTIFQTDSNLDPMVRLYGDNASISHCTLDGKNSANFVLDVYRAVTGDPEIYNNHVEYCKVRGIKNGATGWLFCAWDREQLWKLHDVHVHNCIFEDYTSKNTTQDNVAWSYIDGVFCTNTVFKELGRTVIFYHSKRGQFGNLFFKNIDDYNGAGSFLIEGQNVQMNNIYIDSSYGLEIMGLAPNTLLCDNISINNFHSYNTLNHAIYVNSTSTKVASNIKIKNATIDTTQAGDGITIGTAGGGVTNVTIDAIVHDAYASGLYIQSDVTGLDVLGRYYNNNQAGASWYAIQNYGDDIQILNVLIYDDQGAPTQTRGVYTNGAILLWSGGKIANCSTATLTLGGSGSVNVIRNVSNYIIEHHTAADTLTTIESGTVHTNLGAGGAIKLTLPQDAVVGTTFEFTVMDAQQLQIDPGAAGAIYINGAKQADDAYIWADDEAESVKLVADGNGDWIAISPVGTWTVV